MVDCKILAHANTSANAIGNCQSKCKCIICKRCQEEISGAAAAAAAAASTASASVAAAAAAAVSLAAAAATTSYCHSWSPAARAAGQRQGAGDSTEGNHGLPQQAAAIEAATPTREAADLASDVVDLARDVTIPAIETVNRARDAADLATEATKAAGRGPSLTLMTWNASRPLSSGRELALLHLLTSLDVDVATVTECEIPETVKDFALAGYTTFFPKVPEGKSKTSHYPGRERPRRQCQRAPLP
jgi:hypothetical protein